MKIPVLATFFFYCDKTPCSRQFAEGLVDLDKGDEEIYPQHRGEVRQRAECLEQKLRAHILTQAGSRKQAGSGSSVWALKAPTPVAFFLQHGHTS